ncbi:MAG: hypothetical protein ICV79_26370, partial [Flavisolibacter sp.]|nr:hypothetical protein [Flavisolibacter sp.]
MLNATDGIYYLLIAACIVLSFRTDTERLKGIKWLRWLLSVAFAGEFLNEFIDHFTPYGNVFYHLYIPFEFFALSRFLLENIPIKMIKKIMLVVTPLYFLFCFYYSAKVHGSRAYPSMQYNVDCFIIAILTLIALLNIQADVRYDITALPVFWICSGLLVFYTGIF